ncbi:MAG: hypothetical protein ACI89D_001455, partial [Bermanella sp.]
MLLVTGRFETAFPRLILSSFLNPTLLNKLKQ